MSNSSGHNQTILFANLDAARTDLVVLILSSQEIRSNIKYRTDTFDILVSPVDISKALRAVTTYDRENKFFRTRLQQSDLKLSSFKSYTAFAIMILISVIHILCIEYGIHEQIILRFGASSFFIQQGDTFRAVTALFLHTDTSHLLGNIAGMLIFAAPLISVAGFGKGSFLLLASGTTGNLITAWMHQTVRISIGSSTAVMGAAGLLAAYQMTQKKSFSINIFMPLLAAATLVGLFSQGENTNLSAHVFGFLSGLVFGLIFFPFDKIMDIPGKNNICLGLSIAIIMTAVLSG